jgi:hypothetical protein
VYRISDNNMKFLDGTGCLDRRTSSITEAKFRSSLTDSESLVVSRNQKVYESDDRLPNLHTAEKD